jgi:aspartyl protease family protein
MVIPQSGDGAFVVVGRVNGQRVRFVVDTGATDTVLSPDDARRIGVDVDALRYEDPAETANGLGYSAAFTADRLEVGAIRLEKFRLAVNRTPLSASLLGMSFLRRLESFRVEKGALVLRWREGDDPAV